MAAHIDGIFDNVTKENISKSKLLVVGAGGIGCELLKNLVLTGFENIHVIDLDTIDLSNLNRQFLFHKQHIGKSKAVVAKESVLKFNPKANITTYHDSITNTTYNVEFYRQFTAVVNALDNVGARSHVNRMCMAAEIPLIESGSAGYLGQTTVYKRKITECFECLPRKAQKTYPGCTIRNTPTEPVHCILWAKHLFNQLFGESDDNEDEVSPDLSAIEFEKRSDEFRTASKVSTREWAISTNFDAKKIFQKLFHTDVMYLMTMKNLWENRKPPRSLAFDSLPDAVPGSSRSTESGIQDFRQWSLKECGDVFVKSLNELRKRVEEGGPGTVLVWDKDDDVSLDFLVACSNLRSYCFHITQKNRFDVKAIAGNIIPAIATTNAIVAGLVVLQLLKVLKGDISQCRTSWINETYVSTSKLISAAQLEKPNPICLVCSTAVPEVSVKLNVKSLTIRTLEDKILKEKIHMVQPDVFVNDGTGSIIISSDPNEMCDEMYGKPLSCYRVNSDSRLVCEDFVQNFKIHIVIIQDNDLNNQDFVITSDVDNLNQKEENNTKSEDGCGDSNKDKGCLEEDEPEINILPVCSDDDENGVEPCPKKIKIGTH